MLYYLLYVKLVNSERGTVPSTRDVSTRRNSYNVQLASSGECDWDGGKWRVKVSIIFHFAVIMK